MIVKDLFKMCTAEEFVKRSLPLWHNYREERAAGLLRAWEYATTVSPIPTTNKIVVCYMGKIDGEDHLEYGLYDKEEIKKYFETVSCSDYSTKENVEFPGQTSLSHGSWSEVFGFEIDEKSVCDFGAAEVLAHIMSLLIDNGGYTEDEIYEYQARYEEAFQRCLAEPTMESYIEYLKIADKTETPDPLYLDDGLLDMLFGPSGVFRKIDEQEKIKEMLDPAITEIKIDASAFSLLCDLARDDVEDGECDADDRPSFLERCQAYDSIEPCVCQDDIDDKEAEEAALKSYYDRALRQ